MYWEAAKIKEAANQVFWNPETGRFLVAVDADQKRWDVGCTLINLEVVAGGLATEEHAKKRNGLDFRQAYCGRRHLYWRGHLRVPFRSQNYHQTEH